MGFLGIDAKQIAVDGSELQIEETIFGAPSLIIARYAAEHRPEERFGDFTVRAGYVPEVKAAREFND